MKAYRRKQRTTITAVQLKLETSGFAYQKWGGEQRCKAGDWLVSNAGDVYTIDAASFEKTYREVSPGVYEKHAGIWAQQATEAGTVSTKEGRTAYVAGNWLVANNPDGTDAYAISGGKFEELYEPAD
jgi:hypothetical protein